MDTVKTINELKGIDKEDRTIGFPMTPSRWVGDIAYRPMTQIHMTCGGGLGGASWEEYVERIDLDDIKPDAMLKVEKYDGTVMVINTKYIVSARSDITMYEFIIDTDNRTPWGGPGLVKYRRLCLDGVKISRVNSF